MGGEGKVEIDSIGNLNFFKIKRNYNFGFLYSIKKNLNSIKSINNSLKKNEVLKKCAVKKVSA